MRVAWLTVIVVGSLLIASTASAQTSNFALTQDTDTGPRPVGWVLTPSLLFQSAWDDNVLLRGNGDEAPGDYVNVVNPRIDASYLGRHSEFSASYDGGFALYRQLDTLNSFDQHANVSWRRALSPHVALFAHDSFASLPTTELLEFVAVPFIRTGSRINDTRAGVEATLSKRTSIMASYHFDWVDFENSTFNPYLFGGHSQGGTVQLKHGLSSTTSLIADYSLELAYIGNQAVILEGSAPVAQGAFQVQNGDVGLERQITPQTRIFGAFGFSRLDVSMIGVARTGPAYRAGISQQLRMAVFDANYSRSYVPAFGFGGTYQNEELRAGFRMPMTRRVYVQSAMAWRRNEPLTPGALNLHSVWVEGTVGYALQPWVRLEGFYSGDHQDINQPGGIASRNRIGIQIVTTKPLRVQ